MYNILVCDDEKEITDAVEIYLTQEGYQVFKAYDGNQAIELLKTARKGVSAWADRGSPPPSGR